MSVNKLLAQQLGQLFSVPPPRQHCADQSKLHRRGSIRAHSEEIRHLGLCPHWAHEVFFFANVFIIHLVLCRRCRIRPKGTADRHATQQRPNSTSGATTGRYVPSEGIPAPQYDHSMFAASAKPWPRSAILAHTSAQSRVEKLETRRTLCVAWRGSKDHHQSDLCRTHEQRLSRCNGGGCT
jgi:hypothetical protein